MQRQSGLRTFLVVAGLAALLAVGILVSPYLVPTPKVAVVRIEGDLWGDYTAYLREALQAASRDRAVRAVVLEITSPGGEVTASEDLYYEILKLRESKPVIASIGEIATSGAYYIASAADAIYAKPGSAVGNIGVISILPDPDLVDEELITTGPFKLSGGPEVASIRQMEMLKDTFLAAILAQRGQRLQVDQDVLSRGEVYLGLQAQQMGLVDKVGSLGEAAAAAAEMGGARHYVVTDYSPALPEEEFFLELPSERHTTAALLMAVPAHLPPGFYYRYVEPPR